MHWPSASYIDQEATARIGEMNEEARASAAEATSLRNALHQSELQAQCLSWEQQGTTNEAAAVHKKNEDREKKEEQQAKEKMNQPLDFVAHDLDLMMPGSQPMLTGGPMYNTMSPNQMMPGPYGSQPGPYGSTYGKPF